MNINLIVNGAAYSSQSAYTALKFAEQAYDQGHSISQVFFYRDGVWQANSLATTLTDEFNAVDAWATFAREHDVKLVVCVSAAERRGVINQEQQAEFAKPGSNIHPSFAVEGLGAMLDASLSADRTVTFR